MLRQRNIWGSTNQKLRSESRVWWRHYSIIWVKGPIQGQRVFSGAWVMVRAKWRLGLVIVQVHSLPAIHPSLSQFLHTSVPTSIHSVSAKPFPRMPLHFHIYPSSFLPVVRPFQLGVCVSPIGQYLFFFLRPYCPTPNTTHHLPCSWTSSPLSSPLVATPNTLVCFHHSSHITPRLRQSLLQYAFLIPPPCLRDFLPLSWWHT